MEHTNDFIRSTYALNPECSDELLKTDDYSSAEDIINIDKLVHAIIYSDEVLFYINEERNYLEEDEPIITKSIACKKPSIFEGILRYKDPKVFKLVESSFPVHIFNPYVLLFLNNVLLKLGFYNKTDYRYIAKYRKNNEYSRKKYNDFYAGCIDVLNSFIENIRLEAKSEEFKESIKKYQRRSNDNYESLVKYINKLFDENDEVMVLRVDFGYKEKYPLTKGILRNKSLSEIEKERNAKCSQAQADRTRLFNNCRKNNIFKKHMLGYAWKLEYGFFKGFHYHLFFFFDGSQVHDDINKARMIGEYWKTKITKGRGLYHNCNANKGGYKYLGIGKIHRNDLSLRKDLEKAALYLTKNDYCKIELINGQIFGKK